MPVSNISRNSKSDFFEVDKKAVISILLYMVNILSGYIFILQVWSAYKDQKHDLFLPSSAQAAAAGVAGLIEHSSSRLTYALTAPPQQSSQARMPASSSHLNGSADQFSYSQCRENSSVVKYLPHLYSHCTVYNPSPSLSFYFCFIYIYLTLPFGVKNLNAIFCERILKGKKSFIFQCKESVGSFVNFFSVCCPLP